MRKSHKRKVQDRREKRFYMAQKRLSDAICKAWDKYLNDDVRNMLTIDTFGAISNWEDKRNILTVDVLHDTVRHIKELEPPVLFPYPMSFEPIHAEANISRQYCTYFNNIIREESPWNLKSILPNS